MLSAIIRKEGDNYLLQTQYNVLLARLLNALPKTECRYRAENQCYYISPKHVQSVENFLKKLGYVVTNMDESLPSEDDEYSVLGLRPTAINEVCEAAFKALARINHPDMGGNTEAMQKISEAWNKIKLSRGL